MDDIKRNISLTGMNKLTKGAVVNEQEEVVIAEEMKKA